VVCREWGSCPPQDDSNDPPKTAPICIAIHCRNARRVLFSISLFSFVLYVDGARRSLTLLQVEGDVNFGWLSPRFEERDASWSLACEVPRSLGGEVPRNLWGEVSAMT